MGSSYTPGRSTWPLMPNSRVPPLRSVPSRAYASPPISRMCGTLAMVSALLMIVGPPYSPTTAGKGGRMRGTPRLPSSDSISADSSPTSYAPAPVCVMMSKSMPDPKMFLPRKPRA